MPVLCWASVADGGPKLDQHWVNVPCLLGVLTGHSCVLHFTGCEDIKTVAQLIEPKTRYFGTLVLEYRFCSTRRYSVLVLLKSTCTRTCTQVLLKIKVLLTSTYEYFTSTSHLKLFQNSSQANPKSLLQDMKHSVNDSFTIRLTIILKNDLIDTLKKIQN